MDNGHKRKLYNNTRRQVYVNLFLKGIKTLKNSIGKIILIIMMIGFYILMLSMEGNVEPAKPDTYKDATDYFGVFYFFAVSFVMIPIIVLMIIMFGMPNGAKRFNDNFQRIGMSNSAGEAPVLMTKTYDSENPRIQILNFYSRGFPLSYWQDHKDVIESAQNISIDHIEQGINQSYIKVYAVDGKYQLPEKIEWSNDYLSTKGGFTLVLGESIASRVEIDLSKTPHVLIGGSTGSGKTLLLKLMLLQCVLKGAKVYIADFKGGVDFNSAWKRRTQIITEPKDLENCLNVLVDELHKRKSLLAKFDCANIDEYNKKYHRDLPRLIFSCDEVAQLLDATGLGKKEKEHIQRYTAAINSLVRLGRAMGIHCILATQRPDAQVISGQIKSNVDVRICGRADDVLSQIILDKTDANDLIAKTAQGRFLTNSDVLFQAYYFDDKKEWRL